MVDCCKLFLLISFRINWTTLVRIYILPGTSLYSKRDGQHKYSLTTPGCRIHQLLLKDSQWLVGIEPSLKIQ